MENNFELMRSVLSSSVLTSYENESDDKVLAEASSTGSLIVVIKRDRLYIINNGVVLKQLPAAHFDGLFFVENQKEVRELKRRSFKNNKKWR